MKEFIELTKRTFRYLMFETETSRQEFSLGFYAVVFGLWLLLPAETFGTSPTFGAMSQIAPEFLWGFVFVIVGGLQMHFSTEHVRRGRPHLTLLRRYRVLIAKIRYFLARLAVLLWFFTAAMFAFGNFWTTATAIYSSIALVTASVCVTLGRQV